ncbi:hypothetical protein F4824DRAFT_508971 [Ustulina deusta]|nr:hypothetical protein F4824DRAFT_514820 [Ustulina deusta]KAI3339061.1 hypothetical protein F4824DRAFT_508971 [Ustulina deusta]
MATLDTFREISQRSQDFTRSDAKREAKRQATKAIKRRNTLIGKADDLHNDCGYEVLLTLRKGHRSYIYTSVDAPDVIADLMQKYLLPVLYTPTTVKAKKGRRSRKTAGKRHLREA